MLRYVPGVYLKRKCPKCKRNLFFCCPHALVVFLLQNQTFLKACPQSFGFILVNCVRFFRARAFVCQSMEERFMDIAQPHADEAAQLRHVMASARSVLKESLMEDSMRTEIFEVA